MYGSDIIIGGSFYIPSPLTYTRIMKYTANNTFEPFGSASFDSAIDSLSSIGAFLHAGGGFLTPCK